MALRAVARAMLPKATRAESLAVNRRHRRDLQAGAGVPLSRFHQPVEVGQLLGAGQQQHEGVIGHLLGAKPGGVDHHDALLGGGVVVDVVEAVAEADDGLGGVDFLDDFARHRHALVDDHVGALDGLDGLAGAAAHMRLQVVILPLQLLFDDLGVRFRPRNHGNSRPWHEGVLLCWDSVGKSRKGPHYTAIAHAVTGPLLIVRGGVGRMRSHYLPDVTPAKAGVQWLSGAAGFRSPPRT